jgi:hypothetical protein
LFWLRLRLWLWFRLYLWLHFWFWLWLQLGWFVATVCVERWPEGKSPKLTFLLCNAFLLQLLRTLLSRGVHTQIKVALHHLINLAGKSARTLW